MGLIMQHSHLSYPPSYEIITDGRVLNALVRRGFIIEWDKIHKYINVYDYNHNYITEYNNNKYVIEYFDGCFNPFVCKVINNNEGSK